MKRLLLGTSALVTAGVLMSGPAAAAGLEASLNGYMEQWFGVRSVGNDDTSPGVAGGADYTAFDHKSDTEVHFNARATLDNGLKVQYTVELEGNTSGDQIDESYITLTGSFGQFLMGSENSAHYKMGYAPKDFGITTMSGDDSQWINYKILGSISNFRQPFGSAWVEVDSTCNDDKRLTYFTPRFSGFQFGVSYTPDCGDQDSNAIDDDLTISNVISLGANYSGQFDQISVKISSGLSTGEEPTGNTGSDPTVVTFGALFGFGGFSLGGYYGDTLDSIDAASTSAFDGGAPAKLDGSTHISATKVEISKENHGYAIGLAYETGPWGVSLVWKHGESEGTTAISANDEVDTIHLGAQYKLGPGVALKGAIAYADLNSECGGSACNDDGFYVVGGIKVSF
jgi:outer membrane protein OmpU